MPDSTPKSSQGDTLDQWRKQQKKDLAERQKREAKAEKNKKRGKARSTRGAMPAWLAEFLLIASFAGFAFGSITFGDQLSSIYRKVDKALLSVFKK
jgi:F0F1-type ATP synthase assembly protein I